MNMPKLVGNWVFFDDDGFRLPNVARIALEGSEITVATIDGESFGFDYSDDDDEETNDGDKESHGDKKARVAFELIKSMIAE